MLLEPDVLEDFIEGPIGLYDSAAAVNLMIETMAERKAAMDDRRAISNLFGIPELDEVINPFFPGDLCSVIGLPSNGKSFIARLMALRVVNMLIAGGHHDRAVVWITTEESVETVTAAWIAAISGVSSTDMLSGKLSRVHSVTVNAAVAEVASWPLFIIGHALGSHKNLKNRNVSRRLSTEEIDACLDYIVTEKEKDIIYITLDYLQRVRKPTDIQNREEHIRLTVDWGRDTANKYSTPLNMVTQSKFEVFKRPAPMPGLEDSEWSANMGQSADNMLGVWMPQKKPGIGEVVNYNKWKNLLVKRGMLFLYVAKQKNGVADEVFLLNAKPHLMELEILETENLSFNNDTKQQSESPSYVNTWESARIPFKED